MDTTGGPPSTCTLAIAVAMLPHSSRATTLAVTRPQFPVIWGGSTVTTPHASITVTARATAALASSMVLNHGTDTPASTWTVGLRVSERTVTAALVLIP